MCLTFASSSSVRVRGTVERRRRGYRSQVGTVASFRATPQSCRPYPVSGERSSNRACRFLAHGSRTGFRPRHATGQHDAQTRDGVAGVLARRHQPQEFGSELPDGLLFGARVSGCRIHARQSLGLADPSGAARIRGPGARIPRHELSSFNGRPFQDDGLDAAEWLGHRPSGSVFLKSLR